MRRSAWTRHVQHWPSATCALVVAVIHVLFDLEQEPAAWVFVLLFLPWTSPFVLPRAKCRHGAPVQRRDRHLQQTNVLVGEPFEPATS